MTVMANDLKTRGVTAIDEALQKDDKVVISVRGKSKYVVMDMEHYNYLRECELEAALVETRKDIEAGRAKTLSAEAHIASLNDEL